MSELSDLTQSLSGGYCQQCVKHYVFYNSKMSSTQITISSNNEKKSLKLSEGETGKIIEKFCESTSLHGFSFLHKANTVAVKLIWILALISVMGVGTFFLVENTQTYINSRLVTNIESSTSNLSVS